MSYKHNEKLFMYPSSSSLLVLEMREKSVSLR